MPEPHPPTGMQMEHASWRHMQTDNVRQQGTLEEAIGEEGGSAATHAWPVDQPEAAGS